MLLALPHGLEVSVPILLLWEQPGLQGSELLEFQGIPGDVRRVLAGPGECCSSLARGLPRAECRFHCAGHTVPRNPSAPQELPQTGPSVSRERGRPQHNCCGHRNRNFISFSHVTKYYCLLNL